MRWVDRSDENGIALWIQARPGGITAPIILSVDDACTLMSALRLAIDDRDALRAQLADIAEAEPDHFRRAWQERRGRRGR